MRKLVSIFTLGLNNQFSLFFESVRASGQFPCLWISSSLGTLSTELRRSVLCSRELCFDLAVSWVDSCTTIALFLEAGYFGRETILSSFPYKVLISYKVKPTHCYLALGSISKTSEPFRFWIDLCCFIILYSCCNMLTTVYWKNRKRTFCGKQLIVQQTTHELILEMVETPCWEILQLPSANEAVLNKAAPPQKNTLSSLTLKMAMAATTANKTKEQM